MITGDELRTLRRFHNLTQQTLGELLGYTAKHIGRLEREAEGVRITERCEKLLKSLLIDREMRKR